MRCVRFLKVKERWISEGLGTLESERVDTNFEAERVRDGCEPVVEATLKGRAVEPHKSAQELARSRRKQ